MIFRHVDGLNKFFEFHQNQSAYATFKVSRTGLRLKKTVGKVSETQNHCLSKKFCFLGNLVTFDILRINLDNLEDFIELEIHF